jgi:uncharacterized protein
VSHFTLDSHTHCGYTVPFEELSKEWRLGDIDGGVVFSPVEEIYDRYDPFFTDSDEYKNRRRSVHSYLLDVAERERIYPYFFIWNDFATIPEDFVGIKWHRHGGEPTYNYDSKECERVLSHIVERKLPIVLEEEFHNTLSFVDRIAGGTVVIIPHMGALNGGYYRLKTAGLFDDLNIWTDTALGGPGEIRDFAESFGTDRILFGSDYPFGIPSHEKRKIENLFSGDELQSILSGNLRRLLGV